MRVVPRMSAGELSSPVMSNVGRQAVTTAQCASGEKMSGACRAVRRSWCEHDNENDQVYYMGNDVVMRDWMRSHQTHQTYMKLSVRVQ